MVQNNTFSTLFMGQNLLTLSTVDSTNTYALNLLSNTKPPLEGTVILAEEQEAGRGQQGAAWKSEKGDSLPFSIILYPQFLPVHQQFELTVAMSLGVCRGLERLGISAQVKWPNDIYVQGRKLAGMLIENQVQGTQIRSAIVGIGLNVNQERFPDYLPNPISIQQVTGKRMVLDEVLKCLLESIEGAYLQLKSGLVDKLRTEYLQRLYLFEEPALFEVEGERLLGTITGVGSQGHLRVEMDGEERVFDLKQIKFIHAL